MLYFAYGSNLNFAAMARRCPAAKPLGMFTMPDARLVFRGVADCTYEPGSKCLGGLWRITEACEAALDRYEGIGSGMYRKEFVPIVGDDEGEDSVMYYVMNSTGVFPPSQLYLDCIKQGYRDFQIPMRHLNAAVKAAWDDKAPSYRERHRYRRDGRPVLALPRKRGKRRVASDRLEFAGLEEGACNALTVTDES